MAAAVNTSSIHIAGQEIVPCVINNQIYTTGETFEVVDPHTGAPLTTCTASGQKTRSRLSKLLPPPFQDELIGITEKETTCPRAYTLAGLAGTYVILEQLAVNAVSALKGEIVEAIHCQKAFITRKLYGVVFAITPWNSPISLTIRACYRWGYKVLAEKLIELPAGVFGVIHVNPRDSPKITELILAYPAVGKVNFTGSTRVGSPIA
ncbi:hypothetical protein BOTBODRAFT_180105 [Botryobasidium botryosum FD-172 SS1]|uniref:Aldehyde dehydrogenase domain-containing protein n=1 Tax=Botryobasidium botryosum (strain FD-172 SS1) TaxID=930990 RepID=A0A067M8K9_BOTB1|nr:hypothetical protein BOTBODRAFT_180105 [Botryobasidium botryosum FD-172 SS1]